MPSDKKSSEAANARELLVGDGLCMHQENNKYGVLFMNFDICHKTHFLEVSLSLKVE